MDHGFANAAFSIGYLYDRGGVGIAKDYGQAMEWYRKASAHNVAEAEYFLGLHYVDGAGVDPDRDQARQWFQKAAEHGSADAKTRLATLEPGPAKPPQISTIRSEAAESTASDAPLQPIAETHTLPPYPLLSQKLGEEGISVLQIHISNQRACRRLFDYVFQRLDPARSPGLRIRQNAMALEAALRPGKTASGGHEGGSPLEFKAGGAAVSLC